MNGEFHYFRNGWHGKLILTALLYRVILFSIHRRIFTKRLIDSFLQAIDSFIISLIAGAPQIDIINWENKLNPLSELAFSDHQFVSIIKSCLM